MRTLEDGKIRLLGTAFVENLNTLFSELVKQIPEESMEDSLEPACGNEGQAITDSCFTLRQ